MSVNKSRHGIDKYPDKIKICYNCSKDFWENGTPYCLNCKDIHPKKIRPTSGDEWNE